MEIGEWKSAGSVAPLYNDLKQLGLVLRLVCFHLRHLLLRLGQPITEQVSLEASQLGPVSCGVVGAPLCLR